MRDAFAGFVASLQPVTSGDDAGDVETDSVIAKETPSPEPRRFDKRNCRPVTEGGSVALQKLQEWFDAEIAAMEKTVNDLILPEPSEPRGNGIAYHRFLEIYKELGAGDSSRQGLTNQDRSASA